MLGPERIEKRLKSVTAPVHFHARLMVEVNREFVKWLDTFILGIMEAADFLDEKGVTAKFLGIRFVADWNVAGMNTREVEKILDGVKEVFRSDKGRKNFGEDELLVLIDEIGTVIEARKTFDGETVSLTMLPCL